MVKELDDLRDKLQPLRMEYKKEKESIEEIGLLKQKKEEIQFAVSPSKKGPDPANLEIKLLARDYERLHVKTAAIRIRIGLVPADLVSTGLSRRIGSIRARQGVSLHGPENNASIFERISP